MEVPSNNSTLKYVHISSATDEALTYIDNRRKGVFYSLRTRWKKLNNAINGGFEPHSLVTIAGISSSGKSSFANSLETDLFDMNPNVDFAVLSFNMEMSNFSQVTRKISAKTKKTVSELSSGVDGNIVTDAEYDTISSVSDKIRKYNIYYADESGTVDEIKNTILKFLNEDFVKGKWVVIFLDHVLLTKGHSGETERKVIADLQYMFISIKKKYKVTIIQLSQLNRNIEDKERILNPALMFPTRSDLSSADSIYQCSDLVMVIHRPAVLSIFQYGIEKWPTKDLVYLHCLKNRNGEPKILCFEDHLKYNTLYDYDPYNSFLKV